jgi:hypothetical protein
MPLYALSEIGLISSVTGFWLVVIIIEPLWVFLLVKGVHAAWKLAK